MRINTVTWDKSWNKKFELTKDFLKVFGRFPNSNETYKNHNIGYWCYLQRYMYKKGTLKEWRYDKLKTIDFPFNIKESVLAKGNKRWNEMFELMLEFRDKYNRLPYTNDTFKGENIGNWCIRQRILRKENHIREDRIKALDSIGFVWDINNYLWMEKYNLLKEYIQEYGKQPSTRTVYKGENLGSWCLVQRGTRKGYFKGKLTEERIQLLDKINFRWN